MRAFRLKKVGILLAAALCVSISALSPSAPVSTPAPHADAVFTDIAKPFIDQNCMSCHGPKKAKAGFRIDLIGDDFSAPNVAEQWKHVIDRINAGEMPPETKPRPDARQSVAFVGWVNTHLHELELAAKKSGARPVMRRLNRDEYVNTVCDLLKLDAKIVAPIAEELPGDGKAEGFDRLGVALFFDQTQIERSMSVAEQIALKAIVTEPPKLNQLLNTFGEVRHRPPPAMIEVFPSSKHLVPAGAPDKIVRPDYVEFIQGYPTYKREYDGWGVVNHFGVKDVVRQDGYYRVRIKAKVDNRARTTPNKFKILYGQDSVIFAEAELPLDPSGVSETTLFLRGPNAAGEVAGPQTMSVIWNHTDKAVINEPAFDKAFWARVGIAGKMEQAATRRAPQAEQDELRRQLDESIKVLETWAGQAHIYNPQYDVEKLPRLQIASIEVEGPIQQEWPPASHKSLFFAPDQRQDIGYAREVIARLLPRAYRRPVTSDEIDAIVAVVNDAMTAGKLPFFEAMRIGLQRVLCAPGFLFIEEPTRQAERRPLNDYELASRLSYFLWSTMPDDRLFALAAEGKLHDPATLSVETKRMLADPKSEQFVHNFAGQWLSVRDFASVQPAKEYTDYDKPLERAVREEPYEFFHEVLAKNLPITCFLDSDFLVINERLAKHYGIAGVTGPEFRRVAIRPENHRGGVLGMAGLMTYLADGTRTLPMHRANWVLRELFNDPPNNPPPNAGEIQPNTSGKNLTVRQRLELHRKDEICASCHFKLDPYGLALENYDAIGEWRDRFNGEGFHGKNMPLLDVSGTFPSGAKFATLEEYKAGLLAQKDKFTRAFSTKLLTYALGRAVGYTDHETVDALVNAAKSSEYRMQPLIEAIVTSEPFRTK